MSTRESKILPYGISVAFLVAVLYPLASGEDSFPLSTFPMFSHGRKDPMLTIEHVVGRLENGNEMRIPPRLIANDEVLQAQATIRRAVSRGQVGQRELCKHVADAIKLETGELALIKTVQVRRATYDSVTYFTDDSPPVKTKVFASCLVAR